MSSGLDFAPRPRGEHRHPRHAPGRRGHTHTIYWHGIQDLLPENVELIHGPGCPVLAMPMGRVDDALGIARRAKIVFWTY